MQIFTTYNRHRHAMLATPFVHQRLLVPPLQFRFLQELQRLCPPDDDKPIKSTLICPRKGRVISRSWGYVSHMLQHIFRYILPNVSPSSTIIFPILRPSLSTFHFLVMPILPPARIVHSLYTASPPPTIIIGIPALLKIPLGVRCSSGSSGRLSTTPSSSSSSPDTIITSCNDCGEGLYAGMLASFSENVQPPRRIMMSW